MSVRVCECEGVSDRSEPRIELCGGWCVRGVRVCECEGVSDRSEPRIELWGGGGGEGVSDCVCLHAVLVV